MRVDSRILCTKKSQTQIKQILQDVKDFSKVHRFNRVLKKEIKLIITATNKLIMFIKMIRSETLWI